ncbi:MAG: cache domain-containing protein [Candidatus Eremiobacteraeota bacterium]|nr:cache domain-containing protein [Candidatus Eremiobacteraeota bacterium]MBV9407931.1 cache domain-containing protein [Candidatus Eremiobacteraeota bacterium]
MKLGLRTKLVGTVVGAVVISSAISAIAARNTMATDLNKLAAQQVSSGSTGFAGYWDEKRDSVKLLVTQAAINETVRRATAARARSLETTLTGIARQGGLSFLTVVDDKGRVVARANGGTPGAKLNSPLVARALSGETVNTAATLPHDELVPEQLEPQIESTTAGREGLVDGLGIIAATPISDANERTIGAVYGGIVVDHYYDTVDQAAHALGGKAAVIYQNELISSSITRVDGTRLVDESASPTVQDVKTPFYGIDREGGVDYLVRVEPVLNDQMQVIAARWFGVPLATFSTIQQHTITSLLLWGVVGILIGLAIALPVVERIARQLVARSRQVRASAKELSVVIVGSEVSGDHVAQTRTAVEKQGELLMQAATASDASSAAPSTSSGLAVAKGVSEKILAASALNAEILGDVVVIDTLASEMAARTQQAVARVGELNEVAAGLDELVTGSK